MTSESSEPCELCRAAGGKLIWEDTLCRVVQVNDPSYPGFCRVILTRHVREATDLAPAERRHLMSVVFAVEIALRRLLHPHKINIASLGNITPHLHWHVVPRFADDRHFPNSIWGTPRRDRSPGRVAPLPVTLSQTISEVLAEEKGETKK